MQVKTIKIPVEMCQFALMQNNTAPLKLLCLLKFEFDGIATTDRFDIKFIKEQLRYKDEKSIKHHLKTLIELNWIGYNYETKCYFIRGFESIRKSYGFKFRSSIEITTENLNDIKDICFTAVILSLIKVQKRKQYCAYERRGGRNTGRPIQPLPSTFAIAVRALSKILNLSCSTIHHLKENAKEKGYIKTYRKIISIDLPASLKPELIMQNEQLQKKLRIIDNKIAYEDSEHYSSPIKLRKRKKIEQ